MACITAARSIFRPAEKNKTTPAPIMQAQLNNTNVRPTATLPSE